MHNDTIDHQEQIRSVYAKNLGSRLAAMSRMLGGHVERESHGALLVTEDGKEFVNCAGYGVFLLGATHPDVVAAVVEQVRRHPVSARLFIDTVSPRAAEALVDIAPDGLEKVYFAGSGAEAVETALKLARVNGYRRIVTTVGGYHGRTLGALSVSARPVYQEPFRPLMPDVAEVPFGDAEALDRALAGAPPSCFIVEPVQGEGGVVIPDPGYLAAVSRICAERDCFLIVDEILTGMGRVGRMWGISGQDVAPDVMLVGKTLSGGVIPIAAVLATNEAYAPFEKDPLLHQSTFGGSPVATAAALATIDVIRKDDIVGAADRIGRRLLASFREAAASAPAGVVEEVRGAGLLLGIEFSDGGYAGEMVLALIEHGVMANHSNNNPTVIRLTPPAVIEESEIRTIERAVRRGFDSLGSY
ncbi:aspartate aminotransferase family protein [Saccharothrix sp. NRRL B-16314]|uniref:aspartate aminotransferase family protein n=1 Tax=Saccharothrix sp. NRRL B-16314 TaxID=1463825 RepID=UPI00052746E3|nr:aminotransferase class III-fold pyridoxal phosphate-dependent enzyme [Saccharothrix sp. NRRL B-16314]